MQYRFIDEIKRVSCSWLTEAGVTFVLVLQTEVFSIAFATYLIDWLVWMHTIWGFYVIISYNSFLWSLQQFSNRHANWWCTECSRTRQPSRQRVSTYYGILYCAACHLWGQMKKLTIQNQTRIINVEVLRSIMTTGIWCSLCTNCAEMMFLSDLSGCLIANRICCCIIFFTYGRW